MPLHEEWIPPEIAAETPQGTIYHAYKDGRAERMLSYWYTTDQEEGGEWEFDIRELPTYAQSRSRDKHKGILLVAASKGEIKFPGVKRG